VTTLDEGLAIIAKMKAEARKLPEGFYRLKCDVTNPQPDRRQKHDWRALVSWQKGARFRIVDPCGDGRELQRGKWSHHRICIDANGNTYGEVLDRILPCLRPETAQDNPDTELEWAILKRGHSLDGCGADLLCYLIRRGKVTVADALAALDEFERDLAADDDAVRANVPPEEDTAP